MDIMLENGTIITKHFSNSAIDDSTNQAVANPTNRPIEDLTNLSDVVEEHLFGQIFSLTLIEKNTGKSAERSALLNIPRVKPHVREDRLLQKSELYYRHLLRPQKSDVAKNPAVNKEEPIYAITSQACRLREKKEVAA